MLGNDGICLTQDMAKISVFGIQATPMVPQQRRLLNKTINNNSQNLENQKELILNYNQRYKREQCRRQLCRETNTAPVEQHKTATLALTKGNKICSLIKTVYLICLMLNRHRNQKV